MAFSKLKAIEFGLQKTKENPFIIIGISLVAVTYWVIPFYIVSYLLKLSEILGTLVLFIVLFFDFLILMGYMKVIIDTANQNFTSLKDLFFHYPKLPDFLIGFLFYLIIILVGFVFLVIPGIYFAIRFSFSLFFILQGEGSALESLKKSWQITSGEFFNLLFFYILLLIINTLGFFFFLIGLAFSLPVSALAIVYSYRKLFHNQQSREINKVTEVVD